MTTHVFLRYSLGLALSVGLFAQPGQRPGGGGTSTPTPPPSTNPGRPGIGTQPGNMPGNNPSPDFGQMRPLVFMGKVMMDDGTPPSDSVTIQLVCRGTPN